MNKIDLEGRKAVVTGGAQGIGRAITERLAASGAQVTIWDRDRALAEAASEEIGAPVGFVQVDVTDWEAVRSAVARTAAEMGRIDIMVNNAGIAGLNATVADYPVDEWQCVIDLKPCFELFNIGILSLQLLSMVINIIQSKAIQNASSAQLTQIIRTESCVNRHKNVGHDATPTINDTVTSCIMF